MHKDEPLVPETNCFMVDIATEKVRYKSSDIDQILEELIQAGDNTLCSEIHKLTNSVWNKEEMPQQWKESIIIPIYNKDDKPDHYNYRRISLLHVIQYSSLKVTTYTDEITGDQCGC
jgi:hypothetical protein